MKFEIEKPASELTEGYLNLVLKYITLFIVGWVASSIFLLFLLSRRAYRGHNYGSFISDNIAIVSFIITLTVVYYLIRRTINKYKLGLITKIEFDESFIRLGLLNTLNGEYREKEISLINLRIVFQTKNDNLFGNQRIFEFIENGSVINKLNIELTAWCRHPEVELIVDKLKFIRDNPKLKLVDDK